MMYIYEFIDIENENNKVRILAKDLSSAYEFLMNYAPQWKITKDFVMYKYDKDVIPVYYDIYKYGYKHQLLGDVYKKVVDYKTDEFPYKIPNKIFYMMNWGLYGELNQLYQL